MRMVNIIAELHIIDLSCRVPVEVILADQLENMLWRNELHLFEYSRELLDGDVLDVGWVEILEGRLQEDSVGLYDLLDVPKGLEEDLFLLLCELSRGKSLGEDGSLTHIVLVKHFIDSIAKGKVINKAAGESVLGDESLDLLFVKLNIECA
jgi:hypothetical protein